MKSGETVEAGVVLLQQKSTLSLASLRLDVNSIFWSKQVILKPMPGKVCYSQLFHKTSL